MPHAGMAFFLIMKDVRLFSEGSFPCQVSRLVSSRLSAILSACLLAAGVASADEVIRLASQPHLSGGLTVALDELYDEGLADRVRIDACTNLEALCVVADHVGVKGGQPRRPVLYPAGAPRSKWLARLATGSILVKMKPGAKPGPLAREAGLKLAAGHELPDGYVLFDAATPAQSLLKIARLSGMAGLESVEPMLATWNAPRFVPNDPVVSSQWHLLNPRSDPFGISLDTSLTNVWERFRGEGIVIGIIDDGVQFTHPDLAPNYVPELGWDYNGKDPDPSPDPLFDFHGTACAGVAAAKGNNGQGVSGVAFEARLTGLRLIGGPNTDRDEADAMTRSNAFIHIKSNSWGPSDCPGGAAILGEAGPLVKLALAREAFAGRNGRGEIFTWAGGNGGRCNDNANYDAYANSVYVVAVGSVNDSAERSSYSEKGACLTVVAPSGDAPLHRGIVTTDLVGAAGYNFQPDTGEEPDMSYTRNFSGTSAATPVVSGVVALMLQASPGLGYRDVKEILMRTATVVQPANEDWVTNSAGIHHNHEYGAGLLHAGNAVDLGQRWRSLGRVTNAVVVARGLPQPIPDFSPEGAFAEFRVTNSTLRVEHATVTMTASHANWGDLEVYLISPRRVRSKLAEVHDGHLAFTYRDWTFSSTRHWGEPADGIWRIHVVDARTGTSGRLDSARLELFGSTPGLESFTVTPVKNGMLLRGVAAAPGWVCAIEASRDLQTWQTYRTLTLSDEGAAEVLDPSGRLIPSHRFYRARLMPPP